MLKVNVQEDWTLRFIGVNPHTLVIDDAGIQNLVSFDLVTLARLPPAASIPLEDEMEITHTEGKNYIMAQNTDGDNELTTEGINGPAATDTAPTPRVQEFFVELIVQHEGPKRSRRYKVRWYGYLAVDDMVETANHIPQHFIDRYWRKILQSK